MTTKERKTILKAIRTLDDWIVTSAPEMSDTSRVRQACVRIHAHYGSILYANKIRNELEGLLK